MTNSSTTKSGTLVLFTLAMADQPLSIDDVAFRCGLSYNTVKKIVLSDPRVKKHGGFPTKYEVPKPDQMSTSVITVKYDRPEEGWITWLDEIRPLLVSITAITDTMSREELERKVVMFKSLGRSFVSLARDLDGVVGRNDWAHYLEEKVDGTS